MVKGSRQHRSRVVAIVASIALAIGLMSLPVAAFTTEPAFADDATHTVTVNGGTANKATAKPGEEVTITANNPETGKIFVQWGSASSDVSLNPPDKTPAKFFMPDHGVEFTAVCRELVIDDIPSHEYTGDSITPEPDVYLDDVDLVTWDSKTYRYVNNEDVGTATVFVEFSDRPGSNSATFDITEADISTADIEVTDLVYGDKPDPTVVWESTAVTKTLEEEVDYTVTCSNANVGKATVTIKGTGNFEGTKESEEFNITERPLTITADSGTKVYDGNPLTKNTYSSEGLAEGDTISSVTVTGTITDAGTSDNVPSAVKIVNGEGKDVTANYEITYVKGTLEVTKAPLTITAKPQTYTYNGKQQGEGDTAYDDSAAISEKVVVDGLQSGDSITSIILDGEQTEVGVYEGADGIVPSNARINGKSEDESDYVITYVPGKLTIEAAPSECTVTFENWDGTVLQSGKVAKGEVPKYAGDEPTRPATAQCEYLFVGWEPEVVAVTGDATYTAKYDEVPRLYSVIWRNYDGTEFYRDVKVPYGTMPKFEGAEPTRPSDEQYTYAFSGWTPDVAAVTGDATYTAKFAEKAKKGVYEAVSGAGGTWTQGSNDPLVFTFKRTVNDETSFDHFTGILVDGEAVPEKDASGRANWTAKRGSVVVSLQKSYLATLPAGEHTLTALFDDGNNVDASFTVAAKPAKKATLTFDLAGGKLDGRTGKVTVTADVGDTITIPKAPTRSGYTFKYWKGSSYKPGDKYEVTGDHTFTAVWEKSSSGTTPKTGDSNGGLVIGLSVAALLALGVIVAYAARCRRDS